MDSYIHDINFFNLKTRRDVAEFLGSTLQNLAYNLYILPEHKRYSTIIIPKRSGGERTIYAPCSSIKYYQRRIADTLLEIIKPKECAHAYIKKRSIKTNAEIHHNKNIVINIDLKDFFPSIHFGRVRGVFKKPPFAFNDEVATTLAQICCYKQQLPQGAPSSPVISNLVCRTMDNQLQNFARKHRFSYSRYADDITFSSNLKSLPPEIGNIDTYGIFTLSATLESIIVSNNFQVNKDKLRYSYRNNRQEVTGLVVNKSVNVRRIYVRKIRSMLHAWQKYGLKAAAKEHFLKYQQSECPIFAENIFRHKLLGMIGFVGFIKGKDSSVYSCLYNMLIHLDPYVKIPMPLYVPTDNDTPIVYCEGSTDGIHLQAALNDFKSKGEFSDLNIEFFKYKDDTNISNSHLFNLLKTINILNFKRKVICLFDRDDKDYGPAKILEQNKEYKYWGNNVYSCLLPRAPHRDFDEVCIEHFYEDEHLKITNRKGRRIYLSSEFDKISNKHIDFPEKIICTNKNALKSAFPKIIDQNVYNYSQKGESLAMSKKEFANHIANKTGEFANVSFVHFRPIFKMLDRIVKL